MKKQWIGERKISEITRQHFLDYTFYDSILDIDNDSFMKNLAKTYDQLKEHHTANGKWTAQLMHENITYDPSYYLEDFNIFNFPHKELYVIFKNIKKLLVVACEEDNINIDEQQYYIHAWLNYFPGKMHQYKEYEDLYWHDHGQNANEFHGYYAVNAEPSITHYRVGDEKLDRENINGRLVLAETGIDHAVGKWNFDMPRISIAYNLMPIKNLILAKSIDNIPFIPFP